MRVLHVIPSVSVKRGGPSQAIIQMVGALRRAGLDAEVATTNDDGDEKLRVNTKELLTYQEVPIRFFNKTTLPSRLMGRLASAFNEFSFSASLQVWLFKNIKDYDLVHIHAIFSFPSTIAMLIARKQKIPYVVRTIGQLDEWSLQQSSQRKQIYLRLFEKENLIHASAIHCTSQSEAEQVRRWFPESLVKIVPLGLEIPLQISAARRKIQKRYGINHGTPIFLFLSRLHPKKGLDTLLTAASSLASENFTLLIAGDGATEYKNELTAKTRELSIEHQVKFLGHVSGTEKNMLLQGADAFVLPSHSENFGIAVLESLASGTAVIITEGVALSELVKAHQLGYVCSLDQESLSSAMSLVIEDNEPFAELGSKARDYATQNFQWSSIAQTLGKIYREILN